MSYYIFALISFAIFAKSSSLDVPRSHAQITLKHNSIERDTIHDVSNYRQPKIITVPSLPAYHHLSAYGSPQKQTYHQGHSQHSTEGDDTTVKIKYPYFRTSPYSEGFNHVQAKTRTHLTEDPHNLFIPTSKYEFQQSYDKSTQSSSNQHHDEESMHHHNDKHHEYEKHHHNNKHHEYEKHHHDEEHHQDEEYNQDKEHHQAEEHHQNEENRQDEENHQDEDDHYEPADYKFEYSVHDEHTGDIKSHYEQRYGDLVKGSYMLVEPGGSRRTVIYTVSGDSGFNAVVHRENPTSHENHHQLQHAEHHHHIQNQNNEHQQHHIHDHHQQQHVHEEHIQHQQQHHIQEQHNQNLQHHHIQEQLNRHQQQQHHIHEQLNQHQHLYHLTPIQYNHNAYSSHLSQKAHSDNLHNHQMSKHSHMHHSPQPHHSQY